MMNIKTAMKTIGNLSDTSKMPCRSYSIPAYLCKLGSKLRKIKGSVCHDCYAQAGSYNWSNVERALAMRNELMSTATRNPKFRKQFIESFVYLLTRNEKKTASWGDPSFFRWFDSGDLLSMAHLDIIHDIALQTPNVMHWLPTREFSLIKKYCESNRPALDNLTIRLSCNMIGDEAPKAYHRLRDAHPDRRITFSSSHTKRHEAPEGFTECTADLHKNECNDCRLCWTLTPISYKFKVKRAAA